MPASKLLMDIGERLRLRREEMGLTQKQTAKLLGISETFYGEIERGNRRLSIERILQVREKMGRDVTYLLSGDLLHEKLVAELCAQCPKEKEELLEKVLEYLAQLYR